jgi:hypothetical protein
MNNCFEIGTIQAFLDGEASPDVSLRLTDHVASCDACARLMADAEDENSVVFSALERELTTLVPTQRLWARINEGIEVEKSHAPFWQKAMAFIRTSLLNPSIAAAAGILLVMGLFTAVVIVRDLNQSVAVTDDRAADARRYSIPSPAPSNETSADVVQGPSSSSPPIKVTQSNLPAKEINAIAANSNASERRIVAQPAVARNRDLVDASQYLPGEESYVKTISDLKQNVDTQKDAVMTPSTRVSYERDMAVVNDSIKRMREVVKKNPRNQAARQVLYSSYQDKIDLLNSVAQREELIASMR